jgi:hypothetical protein
MDARDRLVEELARALGSYAYLFPDTCHAVAEQVVAEIETRGRLRFRPVGTCKVTAA